jgi:hypothetical protein
MVGSAEHYANEITQSQKDKFYRFHLYETPGGDKFLETQSRTVIASI